jgi:hypothetical protein
MPSLLWKRVVVGAVGPAGPAPAGPAPAVPGPAGPAPAGLSVTESHTLVDGYPQGPANTAGNAWISDRAAVVTTFTVN